MCFLVAVMVLAAASMEAKASQEFQEVSFGAGDGLEITADLYAPHKDPQTPFVLLFHQARFSRGEYREIAPKLNKLGFNCMAVDLRSGGEVNGVTNETHARAEKAGKGTGYLDAMQDIRASIAYAAPKYAEGKLLIWGSSYSAALVLKLAGESPDLADGVLAFAPGEYFGRSGKPKDWVTSTADDIHAPTFITSARNEKQNWWAIYAAIPGEKTHYIPETPGNHGSRALWDQFADSKGYWQAVTDFLAQFNA